MTEIVTTSPFEALGSNLRFGTTDEGTPFVVGADFARALDYRDADKAARLLDEDERGTQTVRTPGGPQRMTVIYEDGIWELIFRSTKPEAKALKKRVKEILTEIRRTGSYSPVPMTYAEALRAHADEVERREALEARQAIDAPKAASYDRVIETEGMFSMTGIADMCGVPVNTFTGWLADLEIFRKGEYELFPGRKLPRKKYQDDGLFVVRVEQNLNRSKWVYWPVAYATPAGLDFTLRMLRENGRID